MIRELIEQCIEKYYREDGEYYSGSREDEDGNYCSMEDELTKMLTDKQVKFGIDKEDGFDSPGYENSFLAVAFIEENGELDLVTVLLELM
jgi:hypothetical protein|nr:MAG TPA: hypothetical protein [Caudoviricetes sp.]